MSEPDGAPERRDDERSDRRTKERRSIVVPVTAERRHADRRLLPRRLVDVFRSFVGGRTAG